MAFGFASRQMPASASQFNPWAGLPTGGAPWGGSPNWQAAQQAPWRLSPWQTQAMPSAAPVAPPPAPPPMQTSGSIPGFQPDVPGGGFYPQQAAPAPAPAPAPESPVAYLSGGQLFGDPFSAQRATREHAFAQPVTPINAQQYAQMAYNPPENYYTGGPFNF